MNYMEAIEQHKIMHENTMYSELWKTKRKTLSQI